ncbi:G-protein coupled receptor 83-like [Alexandromys fortis]|uniref:G-protein coupled receptor 83-like n=1 Tax=Alexandromys fortis TaxID=100897 RepID=UPI00215306C1|nr:G-protein coupled receptor 83-like [Microtus fortis]
MKEKPTTEMPQEAFQSPGTTSIFGEELTPEALSVPFGFDDLITSTTSQVLEAVTNVASALGHGLSKIPEHMTGDLADTSGPLDVEIVSEDNRLQFWLVVGYTIVIFASIIGNWVFNYIILKYNSAHTASGLFAVNISVTNMMLALLSSPFTMVRYMCYALVFGKMTCHLSRFAQYACAYVTVLSMVAISLDRHRVMLKPLKAQITPMQANICIIVIWIVSTCAALPHAVYQKLHQVEFGNTTEESACLPSFPYTSKSTWLYLDLGTFLVFFMLPLMVLVGVYGHAAKKLWFHDPVDDINIRTYICQRGKKKQTLKMLMLVVFLYGISWMPLNVYLVLLASEAISSHNGLYFILHWLAISSSCYNPYIYCWLSDSFRIEVRKVTMEIQKKLLDKIRRLRGEHRRLLSASRAHPLDAEDSNPGVPIFPRFKDFDELPSPPPSPAVRISFIHAVPRS